MFSYELVERFVRYKPSLRGPVPLLYSERLAAGRDVQPDIYPEETRVGADYNRYIPDRAADVNAGGVWILVGLVAVTLILVTVLVTTLVL